MLPNPFTATTDELIRRVMKNPAGSAVFKPVYRDRKCPVGQVMDPTGKCVPEPPPTCPPGQVWDGVDKCIPDPTYDCPEGQVWDGTKCVPASTPDSSAPKACPPGTERTPEGRCMPIEPKAETMPLAQPEPTDEPGPDMTCPAGTIMTAEGRCIPPEDVPKGDPGCPPGFVKDENGRCLPADDPGLEDGEVPGDEVDDCLMDRTIRFHAKRHALVREDGSVFAESVEQVGWTVIGGRRFAVVRDATGKKWCVSLHPDHGKCCDACALGAPCSGCSGGCGCSEKRFGSHGHRMPNPCYTCGGHRGGVDNNGFKMENPALVGLSSARTGVATVSATFESPFVRVLYTMKGPGGKKLHVIAPRKGFAFVDATKWEGKVKSYGKFQDVKTGQHFIIVRRAKSADYKFVSRNPNLTMSDIRRYSGTARSPSTVTRAKNACLAAPVADIGESYTIKFGGLYKNPMRPLFDASGDAQHRMAAWLGR